MQSFSLKNVNRLKLDVLTNKKAVTPKGDDIFSKKDSGVRQLLLVRFC